MPGHHGTLLPGMADDAQHIAEQGFQAVMPDPFRLVRQVIAALVQRDHPITGSGKRRDLMPPRIPEFREAVQQNHQRAAAILHVMQAHPVDDGLLMNPIFRTYRIQINPDASAIPIHLTYPKPSVRDTSIWRSSPSSHMLISHGLQHTAQS